MPATYRRKQSRAHEWWKRALSDGKHCASKKRGHFYQEYLEKAEAALLPGPLTGPFSLLYRMGFRLGYDNELLRYERDSKYFTKPKKR